MKYLSICCVAVALLFASCATSTVEEPAVAAETAVEAEAPVAEEAAPAAEAEEAPAAAL